MPLPKYHAYLLRLWQESNEKQSNWRIVLVNLTCKEERGFASLERLVTFLQAQMDEISTSERISPDETDSQDNLKTD